MVVAAEGVALPDFHQRPGDDAATLIADAAGEVGDDACGDPGLPHHDHQVVVGGQGQGGGIKGAEALSRRSLQLRGRRQRRCQQGKGGPRGGKEVSSCALR